jgi:hypothetical protein
MFLKVQGSSGFGCPQLYSPWLILMDLRRAAVTVLGSERRKIRDLAMRISADGSRFGT